MARASGSTAPVCGENSERCWARERRVEFATLNPAKQPEVAAGSGDEAAAEDDKAPDKPPARRRRARRRRSRWSRCRSRAAAPCWRRRRCRRWTCSLAS